MNYVIFVPILIVIIIFILTIYATKNINDDDLIALKCITTKKLTSGEVEAIGLLFDDGRELTFNCKTFKSDIEKGSRILIVSKKDNILIVEKYGEN